jgi:hypothetical protein
MTDWAALGLARSAPGAARRAARYSARNADLTSAGALARSSAAVSLAGRARDAGRLRAKLVRRQAEDGSFAGDTNATSLAALALGAGNAGDRRQAVAAAQWLVGTQGADGGFAIGAGSGAADVDTTGLAAWALASFERYRPEANRAVEFMASAQDADGGLPASPGGTSNARSTGLGLAGAEAARSGSALSTEGGIAPVDYLSTLARRNGALDYDQGGSRTPIWVAAQVLLGLRPA